MTFRGAVSICHTTSCAVGPTRPHGHAVQTSVARSLLKRKMWPGACTLVLAVLSMMTKAMGAELDLVARMEVLELALASVQEEAGRLGQENAALLAVVGDSMADSILEDRDVNRAVVGEQLRHHSTAESHGGRLSG